MCAPMSRFYYAPSEPIYVTRWPLHAPPPWFRSWSPPCTATRPACCAVWTPWCRRPAPASPTPPPPSRTSSSSSGSATPTASSGQYRCTAVVPSYCHTVVPPASSGQYRRSSTAVPPYHLTTLPPWRFLITSPVRWRGSYRRTATAWFVSTSYHDDQRVFDDYLTVVRFSTDFRSDVFQLVRPSSPFTVRRKIISRLILDRFSFWFRLCTAPPRSPHKQPDRKISVLGPCTPTVPLSQATRP